MNGNQDMEKCTNPLVFKESIKTKPIHSKYQRIKMTSANECIEQLGLLYIAAVDAKCYSHFGECLQLPINPKTQWPLNPTIPLPAIPWQRKHRFTQGLSGENSWAVFSF